MSSVRQERQRSCYEAAYDLGHRVREGDGQSCGEGTGFLRASTVGVLSSTVGVSFV